MVLALVLSLSPWGHAATTASVLHRDAEPDQTEQDDVVTAGRAFGNGVRAYKEGRYDDALVEFSRAQALAPHPDTLFNVALAQQRLGRHVDAWRTFDELLGQAEDDQEREEILAIQSASRPHVAWVRVLGDSPGVVCFDGRPLPTDDGERGAMLTEPGMHRIDADHARREVMLEGGEVHTIELSTSPASAPSPPRRALWAMAGLGIAGSTAAVGLGLGAAFSDDDRTRLGLGVGAAAAGTIALTSTVVTLVVHRRARRRGQPPPPPRECP